MNTLCCICLYNGFSFLFYFDCLTIFVLGLVQASSYSFLRSGGSSRRAAISSRDATSRDAAAFGSEADPRITDANPGAFQKISSGQRSSPVVSSENRHTSSGRNTSNIRNFESTLRGIESLNFNKDERVHY